MQRVPSAPPVVAMSAGMRPARVLVLADAARLHDLYAPAFGATRPRDAAAGAGEDAGAARTPELVGCTSVEALEDALRGAGGFQLAFLGAGVCAPADLVRLAAMTRASQPGVRIVCCDHGGGAGDAGCDAILRGEVDVAQLRTLGRTLLEASRTRAQRDVALAQLLVADRLGDTGHWRFDRQTGQAHWSASMARLLALEPCGPDSRVDRVLARIHPDDRDRVRDRMLRETPSDTAPALEYRVLLDDGTERRVRQESCLQYAADGSEWMVCAVQPADGSDATGEAIRRLAYFDPLTELPNRSFLNEHLRNVLVHARRHDRMVAILHVNLDGFKRINDTLGHGAGDRMLQEVALRLQSCVRDSDCVAREQAIAPWSAEASEDAVARFGADEFIVVLSEVATRLDPESVAERIVARLREPIDLDGRELIIGASIGITLYPEDADGEDSLLRNAALALQSARRRGRNTWCRFERTLLTPGIDRLHIEAKLRDALQGDGLSLHYQPKVAAMSGRVVGAEALLRWDHPELGSVPPGQFIPIAEQSGLILPLGEWVVSEVCRQLAAWRDAGLAMVPVSINVSAQQLYDQELGRKVTRALDLAGLVPRDLEFEITESVLMDDVGDGEQRLRELKALGSLISMDDFGTGYSSLSYLKRLPIDVVKIDRSFVRDILREEDDQAILRAIIAMAHQLRLRIVAEGVESDDQIRLLQTMNCDLIQGYAVSRPLPAHDFAERFLSVDQRLAS